MILGGVPFSAMTVLWVNFLIQVPIAIALGFDKPSLGLMDRKPRPLTQPVLSGAQWIRLIFTGLLIALGPVFTADTVADQRQLKLYGPALLMMIFLLSVRSLDKIHTRNFKSFDNQKEVTMFDRNWFGAYLVGFMVGGLSGAGVALLFAPQSGEETRVMIKEKSEETITRAETAAADALARAEEFARQLLERRKGVVEDVPERGKSAGDGARSKAKSSDETREATAI